MTQPATTVAPATDAEIASVRNLLLTLKPEGFLHETLSGLLARIEADAKGDERQRLLAENRALRDVLTKCAKTEAIPWACLYNDQLRAWQKEAKAILRKVPLAAAEASRVRGLEAVEAKARIYRAAVQKWALYEFNLFRMASPLEKHAAEHDLQKAGGELDAAFAALAGLAPKGTGDGT